MKFYLPNILTSANIFCGIFGIIQVLEGRLQWAVWAILVGMLFDFCDGLVARLLKAYSEFGKQLDSLADLVTFGVLPAVILYSVFPEKNTILSYFILLYAVFSALRLAKFNIDIRQTDSFIGLPTPASALAVVGFVEYVKIYPSLLNSFIFFGVICVLCVLMIAELPLFALKFKTFVLKDNLVRYIFLLISVIFVFTFQYLALLPIIALYVVLSVVVFFINKKAQSQKGVNSK